MTDIKKAQGLEIFTVPDWYLADCRKNPRDKDVVLLSDAQVVIDQLREELAKAHEYGYQYRQERNRAQQELAALKSAPVVMSERCRIEGCLSHEQIADIEGWNDCLDESERLNGGKP